MRVVFPAILDGFACADADCACRRALRAGLLPDVPAKSKGKSSKSKLGPPPAAVPAGQAFPFAAGEAALIRGAAAAPGDPRLDAAELPGKIGDYPLIAQQTPQGVELTVATLCPSVRALLADSGEPVTIARAEGGWRAQLHVFAAQGKRKDVKLVAGTAIKWAEYAQLRDNLLDLVAEQTAPLLARLTRVALMLELAVGERTPTAPPPLLTGRGFLAYRGFLESRMAAANPQEMAELALRTTSLHGAESGLSSAQGPELLAALAGDWRADMLAWLVPYEHEVTPAVDGWLGVRVYAAPLDRDQSLARGYAEFLEGFAVGLRYAAALAHVRGRQVDAALMLAALALGEFYVSYRQEDLPLFVPPSSSHDRGPRMADLDMTLASVC